MKYRKIETAIIEAAKCYDFNKTEDIQTHLILRKARMDVVVTNYIDEYGSLLDGTTKSPIKTKLDKLQVEYGNINKLLRVIDGYKHVRF